jgi:hypothetical protein
MAGHPEAVPSRLRHIQPHRFPIWPAKMILIGNPAGPDRHEVDPPIAPRRTERSSPYASLRKITPVHCEISREYFMDVSGNPLRFSFVLCLGGTVARRKTPS